MIKDGCAHVIPAAATDLSVFLLVTLSLGWQTGHEDHVGPDPARSESNCLLRVQEVGKIRGVLVLVDEPPTPPHFLTASWSASLPSSLELGGIRTSESLGCAPCILSDLHSQRGRLLHRGVVGWKAEWLLSIIRLLRLPPALDGLEVGSAI